MLTGLLGLLMAGASAQVKTQVRIIERNTEDTTLTIFNGDTILQLKDSSIGADSVSLETRRFKVNVGPDGVLVTRNDDEDRKKVLTRFLLMDVGFAGFLDNGSLNVRPEYEAFDLRSGKSRNINLQLFTQRVPFAKDHLNFSYALMFEFNKYRLSNDVRLAEGVNPLTWEFLEESLRKNKFKATYLYVPLMFGLETNPEKVMKSFRMRGGFYAGVLVGSKQKLIEKITEREKNRDDFNLSKFRYGIRGEMGYGLVNFYVQYSLAEMFKSGQGPELQPINFGVMLLPF